MSRQEIRALEEQKMRQGFVLTYTSPSRRVECYKVILIKLILFSARDNKEIRCF